MEESLALVDRVIGLYKKTEDRGGLGKTLLQKDKILLESGRSEEAIDAIRESLPEIDQRACVEERVTDELIRRVASGLRRRV